MKDYTLVVPTHNRHSYLGRSLAFFEGFSVDVIFVDSTYVPYKALFPDNINYLHLPGKSFSEKALIAIEKCSTPYIAFCADDDFIIESSLDIGKMMLDGDSYMLACVGRYAGFDKDFTGSFFNILNHGPWPNVNSRIPLKNVKNYLSNYHQILWALYRVDVIRIAYNIVQKARYSNDNFIELTIATVLAGSGGIGFLDSYWGVREISKTSHWSLRHQPIHEVIHTPAVKEDVRKFCELINKETIEGLGEQAIKVYTVGKLYCFKRRVLRLIKKLLPTHRIILKKNRFPANLPDSVSRRIHNVLLNY